MNRALTASYVELPWIEPMRYGQGNNTWRFLMLGRRGRHRENVYSGKVLFVAWLAWARTGVLFGAFVDLCCSGGSVSWSVTPARQCRIRFARGVDDRAPA